MIIQLGNMYIRNMSLASYDNDFNVTINKFHVKHKKGGDGDVNYLHWCIIN